MVKKPKSDQKNIISLVYDPSSEEMIIGSLDVNDKVQLARVSRSQAAVGIDASQILITSILSDALTKRIHFEELSPTLEDESLNDIVFAHIENEGDSLLQGKTLDEVDCDWARLADSGFTLSYVSHTSALMASELCIDFMKRHGEGEGVISIETSMRALARSFAMLIPDSQKEAVAILHAEKDGFSLGLWNPFAGLVYETEQKFYASITDPEASQGIFEMLRDFTTDPTVLEEIGIPPIRSLYYCCSSELENHLISIFSSEMPDLRLYDLGTCARQSPIQSAAGRDLIAFGLLSRVASIPSIDLADDIRARVLRTAERFQEMKKQERAQTVKKQAFFIMLPLILILALIAGIYYRQSSRESLLNRIQQEALEEATRLMAAETTRKSAEKNFGWYVGLTDQILTKRQQQPSSLGLINELDKRWPSGDTTWAITHMKSSSTGQVEIIGQTRKEESIAQFARALEFGGSFTAVQPEMKSNQANQGGSAQQNLDKPQIFEFKIRAIYTPQL
jgi:hypothetical protein